jgi:hypothetical protein
MIDVKTASRIAFDYLSDLYKGKVLKELELEEVELSDDEKYWFITVSYRLNDMPLPLGKKYKILKIRSDTGTVVSMKIREINDTPIFKQVTRKI